MQTIQIYQFDISFTITFTVQLYGFQEVSLWKETWTTTKEDDATKR